MDFQVGMMASDAVWLILSIGFREREGKRGRRARIGRKGMAKAEG